MKTGKHFITESHMHILNLCLKYLYLSHVACKHCPKKRVLNFDEMVQNICRFLEI